MGKRCFMSVLKNSNLSYLCNLCLFDTFCLDVGQSSARFVYSCYTSLVAKGVPLNACTTAPSAEPKMAPRGLQKARQGLERGRFLDFCVLLTKKKNMEIAANSRCCQSTLTHCNTPAHAKNNPVGFNISLIYLD